MEQGAPVDVFVSASEEWMDHVQKMGLVDTKTITRIASNALVFIAPRQSSLTIKGVDSSLALLPLLGSGRLSMGEPAHVPAGSYGREALLYFGWYEQLKPRILAAKDVRSALMVVELGEAPLGIVFKTDALKSQKVRIVATIPPRSHKPIVYLAASAPGSMVGKRFIGFINQAPTDSLWLNHGFTLKN
jgi:molybdate transport system substrate-binding protein